MAGLTRAEIVKAAVAEAMRLTEYRLTSMRSELSKATSAMAAGAPSYTFPVMPAGTPGAPVTTKSAKPTPTAAKIAHYEAEAARCTDPTARRGYLELAAQHRNSTKDHA